MFYKIYTLFAQTFRSILPFHKGTRKGRHESPQMTSSVLTRTAGHRVFKPIEDTTDRKTAGRLRWNFAVFSDAFQKGIREVKYIKTMADCEEFSQSPFNSICDFPTNCFFLDQDTLYMPSRESVFHLEI